jgi:hypothetical protein
VPEQVHSRRESEARQNMNCNMLSKDGTGQVIESMQYASIHSAVSPLHWYLHLSQTCPCCLSYATICASSTRVSLPRLASLASNTTTAAPAPAAATQEGLAHLSLARAPCPPHPLARPRRRTRRRCVNESRAPRTRKAFATWLGRALRPEELARRRR